MKKFIWFISLLTVAWVLVAVDSYRQNTGKNIVPSDFEIRELSYREVMAVGADAYYGTVRLAPTAWIPDAYANSDVVNETVYDTKHDFIEDNPFKGLYYQVKTSEYDEMEEHDEDVKLFLVSMDLYDYRGKAIPQSELDKLVKCLEEAKRLEAKCIFRAGYGFARKRKNDADSLYVISDHIGQLSEVLNQYSAQMYCVQAGFYGPWGEWHSSSFLDGDNAAYNRAFVLREWMEKLDTNIPICVRRPKFIREAELMEIPTERIGYHDDGMLGNSSDLGTYDDPEYTREEELDWINEHLLGAPVGGEMPYVSKYSEALSADEILNRMNVSYLNVGYNEKVLDNWKKTTIHGENAYRYITERLGYNLFAVEISYPEKVYEIPAVFGKQIELKLSNNGYAPIADRFELFWVLESDAGERFFRAPAGTKLQEIDTDVIGEVYLEMENIWETKAVKIGVCIREKVAGEYVKLANDDLLNEDGIYWLLDVKENVIVPR